MQQQQPPLIMKELPPIFKDIQRNDLYAIKRTVTANPTALRQRMGADNRTPLHAAVLTGNPAVVRELIHHGAAVEAVDAYGNSVLHLACEQGSLAVVKELLANPERRGVVNSKNMEGITPLHVAAQVGMRDVVMALVECGARADVKDKAGRMPMDVVNPENHPVIQMLVAAGSQVGRPGQQPAALVRQASQQQQGSGSPMAKPMSPAAPGSPMTISRSVSGMNMRVTGSTTALPGAPQMQPNSPAAAGPPCPPPLTVRTSQAQVGKPSAELPNPLLQNEVRDLQSRVAKLDAFFQAQIDLIPEWQKALGLIQNYKRQLDDHEQRMAVSDALSKEARGKADKVESDLRELRNLDNQRWDVHDVAQRNLHTSIHKMTLDQQQFQSSLAELAGHLNHLDPRRPGTLGNPGLGGGAAELQRLRMEMDQLLRSNLMTGLDEVREQLANNIKIQSQLAKACADLEEWRRALDADMPEALEGIKRSVAALQQEMSAGKVQELQDELVALAAQVAVMPKEQPKVLADTVMTMLDSAAVCLQDHDKQLVDVRQQVTALEELLGGSKGGEESEGSGKVAGVMSNVAALQAQVAALEDALHEHRESTANVQEQERQNVEQRLEQMQHDVGMAAGSAGGAAAGALSLEQAGEMEQAMVQRMEQMNYAHDTLQEKVQQLEEQYMQLHAYVEQAMQYMQQQQGQGFGDQAADGNEQQHEQEAGQGPTGAAFKAKAAAAGQNAYIPAHPQQGQQQALSQQECLEQLKQLGYAEADLMTLPLPMMQQLLAQHEQPQQVAPHVPNPAQAHQPKCCVIQ